MTAKRILIGAILLWQGAISGIRAADENAAAILIDQADTATLDNGIVKATIKKTNGNLVSLRFRGAELLGRGGGYWSAVGSDEDVSAGKPAAGVFAVVSDPAWKAGERVEVFWRGRLAALPVDFEIHYLLFRAESVLRTFAVVTHQPSQPAVALAESRMALKLNPAVFDFLAVDERRHGVMPSNEDWEHGTPLNLKEARRLTTGPHAGEVEHKYDYAAMVAQTPAWGWASTKQQLGLWMINPSAEYLGGGPTKVDLTGHLDGGDSGAPVLLNMWQSQHYGGRPLCLTAGESWTKVIGPFALYMNSGGEPEALWRDALVRARTERAAWPPPWMSHADFAPANARAMVDGRLVVNDPQAASATASGAWIGLMAPPYQASDPLGHPVALDWQQDAKYYQHWIRADAEGRFGIPNVRPGSYLLTAFVDGVLGEFHRAEVTGESREALDLGTLAWTPERHGRQLWEIGVPNRSAEEFRHGDHYWQWGLYDLYPQEFPHDVDFVIGQSDWRRDWNYAQPPRPNGKGGWTKSTWRIHFDVDHVPRGTATLRLAICGARGGPVDVTLNGKAIGTTGELPESGVMHRDGIRGILTERDVVFDAALLKPGTNVIALTKAARLWPDGVLYDYLRLELDERGP